MNGRLVSFDNSEYPEFLNTLLFGFHQLLVGSLSHLLIRLHFYFFVFLESSRNPERNSNQGLQNPQLSSQAPSQLPLPWNLSLKLTQTKFFLTPTMIVSLFLFLRYEEKQKKMVVFTGVVCNENRKHNLGFEHRMTFDVN